MTSSRTNVVRDRWGIGHVTAPSAEAAFRAQGWLAASDRLWQMEWDRRRAFGRWAEVAGPAGVAEDRFFRRLDLTGRAEAAWHELDDETKSMTSAYGEGVNAWLEANGDRLPAEFEHHPSAPEPWEAWHCLAVYQLRHLFMGSLHRKLWRGVITRKAGPAVSRAMVGDVGAESAMVPGADAVPMDLLADAERVLALAAEDLAAIPDEDGASNSWAVAGSRTRSGKPLLAGDPHRGIEYPNVYYQCHLRCPEFDVIGLAFPGVPGFPHFGHNADVAWCITHGMADDTDVFVEEGPLAVDRVETIEVKGSAPVVVECAETERGPVVLGEPGSDAASVSMTWTAFHGVDTTLSCLRPMMTARSVDEFEASLRDWVIPVNNVLSVDVAGAISFQLRGRVVERPIANRWTPVPGDRAHSWTGLEPVPFDDLHHWRDPERGFLVTANNRTSDDGPFIALDFAGPARHDRIVELLTDLDDADCDAMRAIHTDVRSLVAPAILSRLREAEPMTDAGRSALSQLDGWACEMTLDSAAPTIYTAARLAWSAEVGRRLGVLETDMLEGGWPNAAAASRMLFEGATTLLVGDGWRLVPELGSSEALAAALGQVMDAVAADLGARLGPEPASWTWNRVHTMVSPHPLASARSEASNLHPPVDAVPGDGDTVRCSGVNPSTGERAASSSVARYVFDPADWEASGWVVPHGVSGVRGSENDLDQREAWLLGELQPMAYSPEAVATVAVSSEELPFE